MNKLCRLLAWMLCCATYTSAVHAAQPTTLLVYTAIENELLDTYKTQFEQRHPDIKINWVRDSTGVITAKLLAEKDAPKADAVIGVAATSLMLLKQQNLLQPYQPAGFAQLLPSMRDQDTPPQWIGMNAWATSLCINTRLMKKYNLPYPKTWQDLTNPIYHDQIAAPNPLSSGSGFMNLSAWIQMWGEEKAWQYNDALNKNVKMYVHSGSKPCSLAAQGEVAIGLSSSAFAQKLLKRRAPIELVTFSEGTGWEMEAGGIIRGSAHQKAAQTLLDWLASEDVAKIGADFSGITARQAFMTEEGKAIYKAMIPNNLPWAAEQRDAILATWRQHYEQR
ncbi:putative 2-aminoethylphosphonate ABC transporter substrate-binding protein [Plesiomonas shigelloides]|uniref:putative 2-aminoethylphosphonate ABC transporter substrate-binding protein n=1 Tax=Plesiomonas TaxID=702 RepID=UPI00068DCAFF|nr:MULTISPECIES: putative 2-aminoethylphosphonate ABC transporter substrate-binding protein [Plesiomonas]MCE5165056.1 putative 2-aminoethylphosphonate ABC transporter substrate-binding protein [Plesiomonas sp. PI-19]QOH79774.1 putative 2-aminoethylphosphonate ABC transporter substrate-binding protein [Plesiomonas shigelloides]